MKQFIVKSGAQVRHNGKLYKEGNAVPLSEGHGLDEYVLEIETGVDFGDAGGDTTVIVSQGGQAQGQSLQDAGDSFQDETILTIEKLMLLKKDELIELCKNKNIEYNPADTKQVLAEALLKGDE